MNCHRCARTLRLGLCPSCDGDNRVMDANRALEREIKFRIRAAVAEEREACAKLADTIAPCPSYAHSGRIGEGDTCCQREMDLASAIRARGTS